MSFMIITDSCCDLPAQMVSDLELGVVPLRVEMDDRAFAEGEMTPKALYDHLRAGKLPKTSAANPTDWEQFLRPALEDGRDVLVMTFSSGLSTTHQSAVIAADDLRGEFPQRKLIVIDTLCAAIGQGLLVCHAARLRSQGKSIEEVAAWVEAHKLNLCHWVTVEDLMHLKRGGRISTATAIMGTMLSIKPIIRMDNDGKLETVSKSRGRKASMNYLLDQMADTQIPELNDTVCIGHGDCLEDAEYLAEQIKARFGIKNVIINYVGAVIGAHTGPGVVFIAFFGQNR